MLLPSQVNQPRQLILDCDPGIDDAVALALILASPEFELLAITTTTGNVSLELTTTNTLKLLKLFEREEIPVAAGVDRPDFVEVLTHYPKIHAADGLGGVVLPDTSTKRSSMNAMEMMASILRLAEPRSITIAVIGPLTNIALVLDTYPELIDRIDELVIMGGTTVKGNITPVSEFNIWSDPASAAAVLERRDLDILLVGLDVTRSATLDDDDLQKLSAASTAGVYISDMIRGYLDHGADGWPMHDALAIAAMLDDELLGADPADIRVHVEQSDDYARTFYTFGKAITLRSDCKPSGVRVALRVDADRFREILFSRLL